MPAKPYTTRWPFRSLVSKPAQASADEMELDPGVLEFLKRPKAINPEDDHFNGPNLNGRWIANTTTYSFSVLPGWIYLPGFTLLTPCPSGDWYIETEAINIAGTAGGPIIASSGAIGSGTQAFYFHYRDAATTRSVQFQKLVNGAFNAQYAGSPTALQGYAATHWFLRIQKVGTTYTTHWSLDGKFFNVHHSTAALGFTPTHFGLHGTGLFNYFIRR